MDSHVITVRGKEFLWNGERRDLKTLEKYLSYYGSNTSEYIPLKLKSDADSDCVALEAIRDALDKSPMCFNKRCIEGSRWDAWIEGHLTQAEIERE